MPLHPGVLPDVKQRLTDAAALSDPEALTSAIAAAVTAASVRDQGGRLWVGLGWWSVHDRGCPFDVARMWHDGRLTSRVAARLVVPADGLLISLA
jgi:hypothetical protein